MDYAGNAPVVASILIAHLENNKEVTMGEFTHFNAQGESQMVDVSEKAVTYRQAVASGQILWNKKP